MQTASEASSPLLDDLATKSAKTTPSSRYHGDQINSVQTPPTNRCPSSAVTSVSVPLAVLEEFNVCVTDTELTPGSADSMARRRRSLFSGSRRSKRPLTTSNGPVSPSGPGPPIDAVVVDMNSNDKDHGAPSRCDHRTLDNDDEEDLDDDDFDNYDADDAMLEFAELYFNAHPAQFSHSALARTVSIVTRKSLNVSITSLDCLLVG